MTVKIILIVLKTLYGLASLKMLLTYIECALDTNKSCRYLREDWIWISAIYGLMLIPVGIMIFSSNPMWTWYKIYTIFMLFFPLIILGTDPYDAYEQAYNSERIIQLPTLLICILFPILLAFGFKAQKESFVENALKNNQFKELKLYSYRDCPSIVEASHIHIRFLNDKGHIKEMKFYPGVRVDNISEIDPKDWNKREQPVIISNENKILYIELDASGIPMGPMALCITKDYYNDYIKRIVE